MNQTLTKLDDIFKNFIFKGNFYVPLKYINFISYYFIPVILLLVFLIINFYFTASMLREYSNSVAEIGFKLLLFIMFVKPLSIIFPQFKIFSRFVALRRQLGILIFYMVLLHAMGLMIFYDYLSFDSIAELFDFSNFIFYGILGLILMFLLFITSNNFSVRNLGFKDWKWLQRLGYLALVLSVIHVAMFENEIGPYVILAVYFVLKIMEWKKVSFTFNLERFI